MSADGPSGGITDGIGAHPRVTGAIFMAVLGPSVAFAITGVDPLLLSLNLSQVSRELDVPASLVGLLGGAATLVVAAVVLAVGAVGDRYGLKRLLMWGLACNIVADSLAAVSPDYVFLLVMRLLDGVALAALLGLSLALLTVSVPPQVRPAVIGIFMAVDTVLYGVTPLLAGWVSGAFGWRWLFLVAPVLALAALALTGRYVPTVPRRQAHRPDTVGVILFGVALLALVYGIGAVPGGISRPQAWIPLTACGVTLAAFICHEQRARAPALELALFRRPAFVMAVLAILTVNFLAAGFSVVLGQFGGVVLSLSAQTIGLLYLPGSLLLAGASILAGQVVAKHGARLLLITGLLVAVTCGLVMAATASPTMALWLLVLVTWLGNCGYYLTATPVSDTILSHAPPGKAGAVASVQPTFGMTGYALGPTIYILLLNLFFQQQWVADAQSQGLSVEQAQHAVNAVTSSLVTTPGATGYDPNLVQQASGLALGIDYTNGVRLTMLMVTLLPLAVAALAYFLMPHRPRPAG